MNIYCDGSCWPNPGGEMGVGVFIPLEFPLQDIKYSFHIGNNGTNQRAELSALILALAISKPGDTVFTDSNYALGMAGHWKAKANQDLVNELRQIRAQKKRVTLRWVKGHNGNIAQEIADDLAKTGRTERVEDRYTPTTLNNVLIPVGACERMAGVPEIPHPSRIEPDSNGETKKLDHKQGRCRDCGGLRPLKSIGRSVGREGWYCRKCYRARYWTHPVSLSRGTAEP